MRKDKYALLIRRAAYDTGDDLAFIPFIEEIKGWLAVLSDEQVIHFYENTSWGDAHSVRTAAYLEKFKEEEG